MCVQLSSYICLISAVEFWGSVCFYLHSLSILVQPGSVFAEIIFLKLCRSPIDFDGGSLHWGKNAIPDLEDKSFSTLASY